MAKDIKRLTICRNGSNKPVTVRTETQNGITFMFDVAPELSDRRIISLVEKLADFEIRGDQMKRNIRRKMEV